MADARTATADFISAPWSPDEVDALNRYQHLGHVHEFTCPEAHGGANRTLYATKDGWRCPHCGYQQDWAHRTMLDTKALAEILTLPCDVMLPPATVIPKGCSFDVMMTAFKARAEYPVELNRFDDPGRTSRLADASDIFRNHIAMTVTGRDYKYEGRLAGVAWKVSGAVRYVIEDELGRLMIHNAEQCGKTEGWLP